MIGLLKNLNTKISYRNFKTIPTNINYMMKYDLDLYVNFIKRNSLKNYREIKEREIEININTEKELSRYIEFNLDKNSNTINSYFKEPYNEYLKLNNLFIVFEFSKFFTEPELNLVQQQIYFDVNYVNNNKKRLLNIKDITTKRYYKYYNVEYNNLITDYIIINFNKYLKYYDNKEVINRYLNNPSIIDFFYYTLFFDTIDYIFLLDNENKIISDKTLEELMG